MKDWQAYFLKLKKMKGKLTLGLLVAVVLALLSGGTMEEKVAGVNEALKSGGVEVADIVEGKDLAKGVLDKVSEATNKNNLKNENSEVAFEEKKEVEVEGDNKKLEIEKTENYEWWEVSRVVDGDTVRIKKLDSSDEIVLRLVGIDTPEVVDPRQPVQCFGQEASDYAKKLLTGQKVRVETDPTQDEYDRYGRWLVYVYLENGLFFNEHMIEAGYAFEYTYQKPYQKQALFKAREAEAKANKRGLWAEDACL